MAGRIIKVTQISRDSFAGHDVIRATVPKEDRKACTWCGNAAGRFRYGTSPDSGRMHIESNAFCSKSCRDSYTH